jgi:hypothetical protein
VRSPTVPTQRKAIVALAGSVLTVIMCTALVAAAILIPAPHGLVPFIAVVCVGLPVMAAWDLSPSIAVLRSRRALEGLRRQLDRLPEIEHPLGH